MYTFFSGPVLTSLQQRSECSLRGKTTSKNFRVLSERKSLISLPCQSIAYSILLYSCYTPTFSLYSYCCLCILIVHPCILIVVYVFLLLSMYSYCSSMYSYRCLCILIVIHLLLDAATLTEVFPCFFLGCKANARV